MNATLATHQTQTERSLEYRLASTQQEVEEALALRFRVFNEEMGEGLAASRENGKDRDAYDPYCDHLLVVDKDAQERVVGTYRILRETVARREIGFYSENEFDLFALRQLEGEKAELGRSCVDPLYRDGTVLIQLWSGIAWYLRTRSVRYLMGCGSLHTTDPYEASLAHAWFHNRGVLGPEEFRVSPLSSHIMEGFDPSLEIPPDSEEALKASLAVPGLLKGYIRAGSRIYGGPALDREFGTTDFFVLFDAREIDRRYGMRYGV